MLSMVLSSTKDIVGDVESAGGPAFYSSLALSFLGLDDFTVITNRGVTYGLLNKLGINLIPAGSSETVFKIEINGHRLLKLIKQGSIELAKVAEHLSDDIVISLTFHEVPLRVIKELSRGRRVVVDVQGFVRSSDSDGLILNNYELLTELAKLDCSELVLRGEYYEFPPKCRGVKVFDCVSEFKASLIITDGSGPTYYSTIDGDSGMIQPPQLIHGNTLGTGDVFTAVFAYEYLLLDKGFEEAVATATAAASLRVRDSRPWYTFSEVMSLSGRLLRSCRRIAY
ncbi:MAG: PfkB family carbohydrate kinase [Sulfolobales archaeon]|nr:PfkB family carbohydrate kinase [Sulfolobales archaeon]MCX8186697.1 PfkB family carbohydrate kinase [Sulfolobales archaeon]MDW7969731.1 PfkB family carbohydrate kinase [Sulfolobales archaeon]